MCTNSEFSFLERNDSKVPHRFICFNHNSEHESGWTDTVQRCLESWRLNAEVYRKIEDTGFDDTNIRELAPLLNDMGVSRLPDTPPEDNKITRNPYITDLSEILSMKLIENQHENVVFPYPRVLHKELSGNQHKGIDLLGYIQTDSGNILLIVEVMASVQDDNPASTVRGHLRQLLDETLAADEPERLIKELEYVHDESEDSYKDILNGFLIAVLTNQLNNKEDVWAVPVMVRPRNKWDNADWDPFLTVTEEFENAAIPSTVSYYAIKCDCTFSELVERVKTRASSSVGES